MGAATFDAFEYGYTTANHTLGLFELEGVAGWLFNWGLFAARVLVPIAILVAILRMRAAPVLWADSLPAWTSRAAAPPATPSAARWAIRPCSSCARPRMVDAVADGALPSC